MYYFQWNRTSYRNHHGPDQNPTETNRSITPGCGEGALSHFLASFT